ncbi:MAG: 4-alpha-glucanotransferase, partial [Desulfuromonadales bacterium]|nr:4-alpha-glucanotransferase [Desulfuromonadales bacterium]
GNPLLINLDLLVNSGDLDSTDLPETIVKTGNGDFGTAVATILPALLRASNNFKRNGSLQRQQTFAAFCAIQDYWLDDYALFESIRADQQYRGWQQWPDEISNRQPAAMAEWGDKLQDSIFQHKYQQFVFFEQWMALKRYANSKGIKILGDLPIFVAEDSADVWANRDLFYLDDKNRATLVAGVPPDYFSSTGQRWGNPLYRWEQMETDDFSWWRARFRWNLELFDLLRVDHFRGFSACWAIPASEPTAIQGDWMAAPGEQLFTRLLQELGELPIIAEDLGIITPDVTELRDQFGFPGMKILQFAFDSGWDNPYLPANHLANSVIYTGTHDNDTTLGWWNSLDQTGRQRVQDFLHNGCNNMPWTLIETAMASVANLAIIPLQDILSLPTDSRMNTPGIADGNWEWRFNPKVLDHRIIEKLKELSQVNNRNLCIPAEM